MTTSDKALHLFVPHYRIDETLAAIKECLEIGWTGLGFKTVEIEKQWKAYSGLPHAHFLNSATAGLHLAIKLFKERDGWRDGDEVITTPLTFVSTNHAILYENLRPVFADVDASLCLDPESVRARITERTRAVMFVGLGGNVGGLKSIAALCREKKLTLILDAAHMGGTKWLDGAHVGNEADVTVFSFQAVKNLPTADSGMICFREAALDEEVRKWTWLGINKDTYARTTSDRAYKWHYDVEHVGYKYHGNSVMAAMGLVALKYVDEDNAYRRQLARWYDARLESSAIRRVPMSADCLPSRHLYQILVDNRDEVIVALNANGIFPGVHYRSNLAYRMFAHAAGTCPRAEAASESIISLPNHLKLTEDDVDRIAASVKRAVAARG